MTIGEALSRVWGAFVREAESVEQAIVHFAEKEITMSLPQNISDALDRIKSALAGGNSQITALQAQVADLAKQGQAKDAQIADLTASLSDATTQLSDIENAVLAAAPPAA